jgi:NAD-dependent SIR2 family protein deacetylase
VHFTENLEPKIWSSSVENARKADVCLVLGTSLNVHPGSSLVDKSKKVRKK